ncbi:hypothetical protein D3C72_1282240 [compost metagenome]
MILINWEVRRRVQRNFVELVIRTRNGHFTVQVDARTRCREETTVKAVIRPTVVEGEVICSETVVVAGGARRLTDRVQITPHCHLRLHIGQVVMHVT